MKNICWITQDCFIDVDLPVLPELAKKNNIEWNIFVSKSSGISYELLIKDKTEGASLESIVVHKLKNRARSIKLLLEYVAILKTLKDGKFDLYYVDMSGMPYFLPLVRLILGKKNVIVATHNVSTPKGAHSAKLAEVYMAFTLKSFENFHVFSENQKHVLESKVTGKNLLFAPLALKDFGKPNVIKGNEEVTFLYFGIIRNYKRVDLLIKAANNVYKSTQKKFKVIIAGACNEWDKYKSLIEYPELFDLRISSIPNENIPDLFGSAHYFVMPYQDIAQSGAMSVAFNYNLPIIASNLDAFKSYITDEKTGYLIEAGSVESLSDKMLHILNNHDETYLTIKRNQNEYVKLNLSIKSIAEKYIKYFENFD